MEATASTFPSPNTVLVYVVLKYRYMYVKLDCVQIGVGDEM